MTRLTLYTCIKALPEVCFDLSRSIEVHVSSMAAHREAVVARPCNDQLNLSDVVTWRARHWCCWWQLTSRITALERPFYFRDEMVKGIFTTMTHHHYFDRIGPYTLMTDEFIYQIPGGWLTRWIDRWWIRPHLTALLTQRNRYIAQAALNRHNSIA